MSADLPQGAWVMLRAGSLRLLLPHGELGEASYLEVRPQPGAVPGLLEEPTPGTRRFVALSEDMKPLPQCPSGRFVATAFAGDRDGLLWCWDEVQMMNGAQLKARPVPAVLRTGSTPVTHFVEQADGLAYLCSAARLRAFALEGS
ncbi:hypothetical protein [Ramlibacter tataouinensis]|nr:hypothetical protein [Ramlibacter tataouinensis]